MPETLATTQLWKAFGGDSRTRCASTSEMCIRASDFSEAAAKLLIERVEAGNALPEPERRIFTTHMNPVFERKVTLPKPEAAPTETDEKELSLIHI